MAKYPAKGTLFQTEIDATPGTYQTVAQVRNIGGPAMAGDAIDVSCMESPGFYRQFVQGYNDAGEVTLELLFDPVDATQDAVGPDGMLAIFNLQEQHGFQIVFSDVGATIWRFEGLVTAYEPAAPFDEALTASITVKLTGAPTFAAV